MKIDLDFEKDVWNNCPPSIVALGNKSSIYKFSQAVFNLLIKERSIKELSYIAKGLSLSSANSKWLDLKGEIYGVKRNNNELDSDFRTRIRAIKLIKAYNSELGINPPGIPRKLVREFIKLYTGLNEIEFYGENDLSIRIEPINTKASKEFNCIVGKKATWSRGYIHFWNMPSLDIEPVNTILNNFTEAYQRTYFLPYINQEAVKKVLDYYGIDHTLERIRNNNLEVEIKVGLKSDPSKLLKPISIFRLKKILEKRVKGYKYDIYPAWT